LHGYVVCSEIRTPEHFPYETLPAVTIDSPRRGFLSGNDAKTRMPFGVG
jgi:hypothetical protein